MCSVTSVESILCDPMVVAHLAPHPWDSSGKWVVISFSRDLPDLGIKAASPISHTGRWVLYLLVLPKRRIHKLKYTLDFGNDSCPLQWAILGKFMGSTGRRKSYLNSCKMSTFQSLFVSDFHSKYIMDLAPMLELCVYVYVCMCVCSSKWCTFYFRYFNSYLELSPIFIRIVITEILDENPHN